MAHSSQNSPSRKTIKRPNGAGSIYKVKDKDVWAVQFMETASATGKRLTREVKKHVTQ